MQWMHCTLVCTTYRLGCKHSTLPNLLWLPFVEPVTDHHRAGKRRDSAEPGMPGKVCLTSKGQFRQGARHPRLEETNI